MDYKIIQVGRVEKGKWSRIKKIHTTTSNIAI